MPTASAIGGGKAFPIMRHAVVFRSPNDHESGNPWIRAIMRGVSRGMPVKSFCGASFAMLFPSIPIAAHALRALVGPKSGPPCFLLPPTSVGAMVEALFLHSAAPCHSFSDIKSNNASPTVGAGCRCLGGNENVSVRSLRTPIITTRGRN